MATVQADDSHPFFQPLCELVFREFGYMDALKNALRTMTSLPLTFPMGWSITNEPLTICAVTGQSYRKSPTADSVGNAIGREIIVKIQSREVSYPGENHRHGIS
jgi:hypothetical protein